MRDNRQHGTGFEKKNNWVFEGHFEGGKKEGQGTMRYAHGEVYSGAFANNRRHGFGTLTAANRESFREGSWQDGAFIEGTEQHAGRKYVGGVEKDKRHGKGTLMFESGTVVQGDWRHGELVKGFVKGISGRMCLVDGKTELLRLETAARRGLKRPATAEAPLVRERGNKRC